MDSFISEEVKNTCEETDSRRYYSIKLQNLQTKGNALAGEVNVFDSDLEVLTEGQGFTGGSESVAFLARELGDME